MDCQINLKKLDKDSLKDLVEFLKEDWPRSAPLIGKITQSQRSAGQMLSVHVYVDSWPLPQLVILENLTYNKRDETKLAPLLVYTRNMTTERVVEVFKSTPFLQRCYQRYSEFHETEYRIIKIVKDASHQYGFQVDVISCAFIYSLTDKTKLSEISIPNGYGIKPLKYNHADIVNTNWKFGGNPQMLARISLWIQYSFSAGVFCSQTNELAAWGLVREGGCIAALQTKEPHRGKGLAKAVITELVRQAQNEGMTPIVYIEEDNVVSQSMFQKMGFRKCQEGHIAFFDIVSRK